MILPDHRTTLVQQLHDAEGRGYGPAAWTLRRVLAHDEEREDERDTMNVAPDELYLPGKHGRSP